LIYAQQAQVQALVVIAESLAKLVDQIDNVTGASDGEPNIRVHDIGR